MARLTRVWLGLCVGLVLLALCVSATGSDDSADSMAEEMKKMGMEGMDADEVAGMADAGEAPEGLVDEEDDDAQGPDGADAEDDDEDEDEDDAAADSEPQSPETPAVIDPKGKEGASGYTSPPKTGAVFYDDFQSGLGKWIASAVPMYTGRFQIGQGAKPTFAGDRGLIIPEKARHYGFSAPVEGVDVSADIALQYEVKLEEGMTCGGAYLKLPTDGFEGGEKFDGSTKYSIMFGPDKCGSTDKVHFIFQSKHPVTGAMTEHHLKNPPSVANTFDKKTHLYGLSVFANGSYALSIDSEVKVDGSLSEDFEPPVQPPKEIDDPEDKKPEDWVDEVKMTDPNAVKPDDWDEDEPSEIPDESATKPEGWLDDEPAQVPDPEASQPDEWDTEEDGEWEAPMVDNPKCEEVGCGTWTPPMVRNPKYKGKWRAPRIDNPNYIGVWTPRKIRNPDYYDAGVPKMLPIRAVGFEIWTMDQGVVFDNVWIGNDVAAAAAYADATFSKKQITELAREEAENKKEQKAAKSSKKSSGDSSAVAKLLDRLESAVDALEVALIPLQDWLSSVGGEPALDKLLDLGVTKPMVVVVSAPLLLVAIMLILVGGGKKKTQATAAGTTVADKKKTDEATPDDAAEKTDESSTTDTTPATDKTVRKRRAAVAE